MYLNFKNSIGILMIHVTGSGFYFKISILSAALCIFMIVNC